MEPEIAAPTTTRTIESVRYDSEAYQKLRDAGDMRSFAADQLHDDLKFVLGHLAVRDLLIVRLRQNIDKMIAEKILNA